MGIGIELMRSGIGQKIFFRNFWGPVTHAKAAVARFSTGYLSVPELAEAMIRDCFGKDFIPNSKAAAVYQRHLVKVLLSVEEKEQIGSRFIIEADQHGEIFIQPAKQFLRLIDIDPKIYFYSSVTAPFLK